MIFIVLILAFELWCVCEILHKTGETWALGLVPVLNVYLLGGRRRRSLLYGVMETVFILSAGVMVSLGRYGTGISDVAKAVVFVSFVIMVLSGIACLIFRYSFTRELSHSLDQGNAVWTLTYFFPAVMYPVLALGRF